MQFFRMIVTKDLFKSFINDFCTTVMMVSRPIFEGLGFRLEFLLAASFFVSIRCGLELVFLYLVSRTDMFLKIARSKRFFFLKLFI